MSVYIEYSRLVIRWSQPWFFFYFRLLKSSWTGLPILPIYPPVSFVACPPSSSRESLSTSTCLLLLRHPSICAVLPDWFLSLHLPPAVVPIRDIKCPALISVDDGTRQIPIDPISRYRVKLVGSNDYRLPFSFSLSLSLRAAFSVSCVMLRCSEILCLKYVQYCWKV